MALYIHIPFCRKACSYCDFHFSVNHGRLNDMTQALVREIELRKDYLKTGDETPVLQTVYFGGGTPSLLEKPHLDALFTSIRKHYRIAEDAEITLEANPDDLTPEKLAELRETPINRLSVGIQSFFDDDLQLMNRAHDAQTARKCVLLAAEAGFTNMTIDLIYGIPGMDVSKWERNLEMAFSLPVQHLSCYSLTVENRTLLHKQIREGKVQHTDDEEAARHFKVLMRAAAEQGFEHYEISNFAKPGFYSRHNSSYWQNKNYIGIGPSAHSYNGVTRQWNIAANAAYMMSVNKGEIPAETETLTQTNRYNEYLMTGLRARWGVSTRHIREHFGEAFENDFLLQMQTYIESGDLIVTDDVYTLSDKGKLIADRISARAFMV